MNVKKIIAQMTPEEKVSFLSGKDFWQTMDSPKYGITSMFLADGPHGIRKQMVAADHLGLNESLKATCFPTAAAMANSWNVELGQSLGECLGEEAACQKVNVLLGPGINIKRNPLCGRNFEYFSEDPYLSGKMGAAYVRGIQKSGIAACPKHFAVNNQEERRMAIDTVVDERTLREIYLTAFEIVVKEGNAKTIMSSYNRINGEYANENTHLLKDILRKDWGFDGVIVTDWGGNNDRVKALKAGNELEMPTTGGETNRDVLKALESGEITEGEIDEALERLLTLVFQTEKLFKSVRTPYNKKEHRAMALKAAEESIVLLRNDGGVLPLKPRTRVALIGDFADKPRYQGAGSSVVNAEVVDSARGCIKDYDLNVTGYAQGFKRFGKRSKKLIKKAVKLAEGADVILVYLGLDEATETEGLDRGNLRLPQNQRELVSALCSVGKKVVAALSCGSALEMDWADGCHAILHGYLCGEAGARAMLNVLTGAVNPSGKLAESYPLIYSDCPSSSNFPGKQKTVEYREGLYVGYRYYDTAGVKVKYPFGYGLSYTEFSYCGLKLNDVGVTFTVTNTGALAGAEIAQLYIGACGGKVFRPKKELKGFVKVFLQSGESKVVQIPFDDYTFRYFNAVKNKWEIEHCSYRAFVGASVEDIRLTGDLNYLSPKSSDGTGECNQISAYDQTLLPSYYSGKAADVGDKQFQILYGKTLPKHTYDFIKKNRLNVDYNTTVSELKYARGFVGRYFAGGIRFAYKFLKAIKKINLANMLMLGVFDMPMRGLSRMTGGAISWGQLDGLILMFNGHFFRGFNKFCKEGRAKKRRIKAEKRAAKNGEKL